MRTIENDENDRKFYNYVCSLSDQKLHNIFSYFLKQIILFYCGDFSFQYLDGIDDFTVIDEIDAIFVNINKIINEIINNHETAIINFLTNIETKKLMCWVNYDKLRQKLYKKYTVNSKHDQILDKNNIFSKAILLPYIHNFFLRHYNNFTLDIQDMI
ncbi:hypothetical protein IJR75_00005 [bacterium]|nr:hypothetical protein [bacterium]